MRAWIHKNDLDNYKYLCAQDGYEPQIIEETDDKAHVNMAARTASTWNMLGYWFEMG